MVVLVIASALFIASWGEVGWSARFMPGDRSSEVIELRDYLDLTFQHAQQQWLSILARIPVGLGVRQGDFTPVETLICFGLGLIARPSRSGKINLRESDNDVQSFAALFKRPPGSLALKLANLDGRRENRAKHEQELWIALTDDHLHRFEILYAVILEAGRSVGLEDDRLPDFLGSETKSLQAVLDADRVSEQELQYSIEEEIRGWRDRNPEGDLAATEKVLLGTARIGQTQFAHAVLDNCGYACVFCGLGLKAAGLPSSRMLVASHVKSWRASDSRERLDVRNGLAACPTHDAAFDTFLITVSSDLRIMRGNALGAAILVDEGVAKNFGASGMLQSLALPDRSNAPLPEYLDWHRSAAASI
jgi:putative restriction endonuclease